MKLNRPFTLQEIAEIAKCEFVGEPQHMILGLNEIHMVEAGDLVFVDHPKYYEKALQSEATTILIDKKVDCPQNKALLISEKPFDTYNALAKHFAPISSPHNQELHFIHPNAVIYPNVFIGKNVRIGKNSRIYPGVSLMDNTTIGENCIVGPK
jgi:UDP-3-O-[3-hydroxymyristoyl] glucosamine N-acyltransferase